MSITSIFFLFALILIPQHIAPQSHDNRLIYVAIVFRHGDRSPGRIIPMENYTVHHWPKGFKKLTQKGIEQTHELGRYIRQTYGSLMKDLKAVTVQSSGEDRTIESAFSLLHGAYPSNRSVPDRSMLSSHPVPVDFTDVRDDPWLKPSKYHCGALDLWKKRSRQLFWHAIERDHENQAFLTLLKQKTGLAELTLQTIEDVYRPLMVQKIHNVGWPSWITTAIWNRIQGFFHLAYTTETLDQVESKFRGGLLTGRLVDLLTRARDGKLKDKVSIFSTHAGTLMPLMSNMGIFDHEYPSYASSLFIELWRSKINDKSQYEVKLGYRNGTDYETYGVMPNSPSCNKHGCSLDAFSRYLGSRIYTTKAELDDACNSSTIFLL